MKGYKIMRETGFKELFNKLENGTIRGFHARNMITKQSWLIINLPNPTILWEDDGNGYFKADYEKEKPVFFTANRNEEDFSFTVL